MIDALDGVAGVQVVPATDVVGVDLGPGGDMAQDVTALQLTDL